MSEPFVSKKVSRWLERLPGARVIIEADSVELCAREAREVEPDPGRYVSRDNVPEAMRDAVLSELVDEMALWEANGWEYEESEFVRELLRVRG